MLRALGLIPQHQGKKEKETSVSHHVGQIFIGLLRIRVASLTEMNDKRERECAARQKLYATILLRHLK
jgi:hypothetical protein